MNEMKKKLTLTLALLAAAALLATGPRLALAGEKNADKVEKVKKSKGETQEEIQPGTSSPETTDAMPDAMSETGKTKKVKLIKADKMDKKKLRAELDAASDDTVVEYKGKKMTKKQLKADAEKKAQEEQEAMKSQAPAASGSPNAVIGQFNQQEQAKLEAANARVRAEMTRLIRLNPNVEATPGQANPASGAPVQRSIGAPIYNAPAQQNIR